MSYSTGDIPSVVHPLLKSALSSKEGRAGDLVISPVTELPGDTEVSLITPTAAASTSHVRVASLDSGFTGTSGRVQSCSKQTLSPPFPLARQHPVPWQHLIAVSSPWFVLVGQPTA